jgi:hypothetical protein
MHDAMKYGQKHNYSVSILHFIQDSGIRILFGLVYEHVGREIVCEVHAHIMQCHVYYLFFLSFMPILYMPSYL